MDLWQKWRKRTWAERRLVLEAAWWVAAFSAAVHFVPVKRIVRQMDMIPKGGTAFDVSFAAAPVTAATNNLHQYPFLC